jgi:hypothetical protein
MNKESKAADDAAFASHIERQQDRLDAFVGRAHAMQAQDARERRRIDAAIAGALAFLFVLAGVAALAAAVCGL